MGWGLTVGARLLWVAPCWLGLGEEGPPLEGKRRGGMIQEGDPSELEGGGEWPGQDRGCLAAAQ